MEEMCLIVIKINVTIERNLDGPKIFIFFVQNGVSQFFFSLVFGLKYDSHVSVKFTQDICVISSSVKPIVIHV